MGSGCDTCRRRKVKCDGRSGVCERCEKLGLQCLRDGPSSTTAAPPQITSSDLTQAGHKRIRTTAACVRCRTKKLKCDAQKPSCSLCSRKGQECQYVVTKRRGSKRASAEASSEDRPSTRRQNWEGDSRSAASSDSPPAATEIMQSLGPGAAMDVDSQNRSHRTDSVNADDAASAVAHDGVANTTVTSGRASNDIQSRLDPRLGGGLALPTGRHILPYLDSFLENVHPISCNNFLHPGSVCAGIHKAPPLLLLAICASSSKFMQGEKCRQNGAAWAEEAKSMIMKNMDTVSTLSISAIQFLALHEMHDGNYTSAWTLVGVAIRMALELRLYEVDPSTPFLQQECRRRLLWAVLVSDLLFDNDQFQIDTNLLLDLPLPCNLWNFTQGTHCETLTLRQMQSPVENIATQQQSNHCAFLISILVVRRKIMRYIRSMQAAMDVPWLDGSLFSTLRNEISMWRRNLPKNYVFNERHMYMFRVSRHLDIFMMIHAYYHQCCILLYGVFLPDSLEPRLEQVAGQAPPQFLQDCAEEFLAHAKEMSVLIQRVFKVEPDHLFRDPWFSLCIWDSTCALLTSMSWQANDAEGQAEVVEFLKANLQALTNTMPKMPLAEQIYQHCCAAIRHHNLQDATGIPATPNHSGINSSAEPPLHLQPFCRRYMFFSTTKATESPEWNELLAASSTNMLDLDEADEPRRRSSIKLSNSRLRPPHFQNSPFSTDPMQTMDGAPSEMTPFWSPEDMQWWQLQNSYMDPSEFAATLDADPRQMQQH